MKRAYLLTGRPGTGKTTLIKEVLGRFEGKAGGFYTEEIRIGGVRQGFRLITLDGESTILAHVNIHSPYRVSKYGVDVEGLDRVGVRAIRRALRECDLVIIDEIGKMELFSPSFREAVLEAVSSSKMVLRTIMLNPHPFSDEIKRDPRVALVLVTRMNRDEALVKVSEWLKGAKAGEDNP